MTASGPVAAQELRRALSDGATLDLLLRLQRGKPRTAEQIREIAPDGVDLSRALVALEHAGLIAVERAGLRVEEPAPVVAGAVTGALEAARHRIGDLRELLALLRVGERRTAPPLPSGPSNDGLASLHFSAGDVRTLWAGLFDGAPAAARIAIPGIVHAQALLRDWLAEDTPHAAHLSTSSILIGARHLIRPEARTLTAALHDAGAELRLAGQLPYWLAVAGVQRAMLSADDGRLPLTGVITTGFRPVVDALGSVFDTWWADAVRYPLVGSVAERGLALRARGLKDDDVAAVLGVSSRTLQREFAVLMDELGVRSRFELGMWWATQRRDAER